MPEILCLFFFQAQDVLRVNPKITQLYQEFSSVNCIIHIAKSQLYIIWVYAMSFTLQSMSFVPYPRIIKKYLEIENMINTLFKKN